MCYRSRGLRTKNNRRKIKNCIKNEFWYRPSPINDETSVKIASNFFFKNITGA